MRQSQFALRQGRKADPESILTDELLADLIDGDNGPDVDAEEVDEEALHAQKQAEQYGQGEGPQEEEQADQEADTDMLLPEGGVKPAEELDRDEVEDLNLKAIADVKKVAKLASSSAFQECVRVRILL